MATGVHELMRGVAHTQRAIAEHKRAAQGFGMSGLCCQVIDVERDFCSSRYRQDKCE
jgi:hypothetical protein